MKELDFKLFIELGKCDIVDSIVSVALSEKEYSELLAFYQDDYDFKDCGDIYDKVYAAAEEQLYQDAEDFSDDDEDDDDDSDMDDEDDDEDDDDEEDEIYIPPFNVDYPDELSYDCGK